MPELPEVETIVRDLDRELKHKQIIAVEFLDKKVFQSPDQEIKNIIGQKIKAIRRRAKMIIIDLGDSFLIIHLKMTGQLALQTGKDFIVGGHPIINQNRRLPNKFSRAIFKFNDSSILFFNDVRRFGWIKLATSAEFLKFDQGLGVEPLSFNFTLKYFRQVLSARPRTTIKQALLEQKHIAGIGNIYADESLFLAGIKPFRRVRTLKTEEIKKLWRVIPQILRLAIKRRGTSFSDYVDAQGQGGNFIKYLKVYGRAGVVRSDQCCDLDLKRYRCQTPWHRTCYL